MAKKSDDKWIDNAIQRDMIASIKMLGKGKKKNATIVLIYKIKSLGEDKRLKIEMDMNMYNLLARYGADFDDFSKGEKLFDEDKEKFNNFIKAIRANFEIVDKDYVYRSMFGGKTEE